MTLSKKLRDIVLDTLHEIDQDSTLSHHPDNISLALRVLEEDHGGLFWEEEEFEAFYEMDHDAFMKMVRDHMEEGGK